MSHGTNLYSFYGMSVNKFSVWRSATCISDVGLFQIDHKAYELFCCHLLVELTPKKLRSNQCLFSILAK